MMYRVSRGEVPEYLASNFTPLVESYSESERVTRGKTQGNFQPGRVGKEWGKRRFSFHGALLWNKLPPKLKAVDKIGQFKSAILKLAREGFKFYSP